MKHRLYNSWEEIHGKIPVHSFISNKGKVKKKFCKPSSTVALFGGFLQCGPGKRVLLQISPRIYPTTIHQEEFHRGMKARSVFEKRILGPIIKEKNWQFVELKF